MSEVKASIKRVTIDHDNMARLERLAENESIKVSEVLDRIVNKAILSEYTKQDTKTPFYIWKS